MRISDWSSDVCSSDLGGVKTGKPILTVGREDEVKDKLLFRDTMTSSEVVELWEATMTKVFKTTLAEGKNVQPVKFAGMDGFRFDFNYVDRKSTRLNSSH